MRGELHRQIPPVRGYPARIPRVQAPARPVLSGPECRMAGHPGGIPSGVQPFSITQPDYSHEHPSHSAPAAPPPPFKPPKCIPLGNIPVFFSQCPKSRQILGIREAFFCSIPKISRLFDFSQKKPRFLGTGEKKRLICPISSVRTPTPYPFILIPFPCGSCLWPGAAPISTAGRGTIPYSPAPARRVILPPQTSAGRS